MAIEGARARARTAVMAELTAEARRQLAEVGPAALSLRSVARSAGMVSSGVYRYFASRDDLLTALIIQSYDDLGEHVERTVTRQAARPPLDRWVGACRAIRRWGTSHPHEWALVYGTPVPGYEAPQDTIVPATRVSRALISIVADAARAGQLQAPAVAVAPTTARLAGELTQIAGELGVDITPESMVPVLTAWTQVFGMVSFELFGQTRGAVTAHEELFVATVTASGRLVGLGG